MNKRERGRQHAWRQRKCMDGTASVCNDLSQNARGLRYLSICRRCHIPTFATLEWALAASDMQPVISESLPKKSSKSFQTNLVLINLTIVRVCVYHGLSPIGDKYSEGVPDFRHPWCDRSMPEVRNAPV